MKLRDNNKGLSVIEVLFFISIMAVALFAISRLSAQYVSFSMGTAQHNMAVKIASEGIEAVRNLRDDSWSSNIASKSIGTAYYAIATSSAWTLASSDSGLIDGVFNRKIFFRTVYRDVNDDIASSGTADANIRKVDSIVSWQDGIDTKTATISTYIANIWGN